MVKQKRTGVNKVKKGNLDKEIKKVEKSRKTNKLNSNSNDLKDLINEIPEETLIHLRNSNNEFLLAAKSALNGLLDQAIEGSNKFFK